MSLVETILGIFGLAAVGAVAWFKRQASRARSERDVAKATAESATGALDRDRAHRTAGNLIRERAEASRQARAAEGARLETERAAAEVAAAGELKRTTDAAAAGSEALNDRANAAIREGKVPRGKPQ